MPVPLPVQARLHPALLNGALRRREGRPGKIHRVPAIPDARPRA